MGDDRRITNVARAAVIKALRSTGYELRRIDRTPRAQFRRAAQPIFDRRAAQTLDTVEALRRRYEAQLFGDITMWDALNMLAHVIDGADQFLMNVSQEVHTLQVTEAVVAEGGDDTLVLAALIHDVGKVLYLVDEDPANISGSTIPIGEYEPEIGLDRCVIQWGADEFAYSRIVGRVPDHVSWLVRYHSLEPGSYEQLMDDRDREYYERYWKVLYRLDHQSKSIDRAPRTRFGDYRQLVDAAFPEPIPF